MSSVVQEFRFCHKCYSLFAVNASRSLDAPQGHCPAKGFHEPMGYRFQIQTREVPSATAQDRWRACGACSAMFYDGYPQKGTCPRNSRGHVRETRFGNNLALPHDVPGTPRAQTQWRFCGKCHVMFYDGYPNKGRCSGGGGHFAQGYDFVLPHLKP